MMNWAVDFEEVNFGVDAIFNFTYGFAEGTAVIEGASFETCIASATLLQDSFRNVSLSYEIEFAKYNNWDFSLYDPWPYLLINDQLIAILYSLHGLVNGCYYGAFEAWGTLGDYTLWLEDPGKIASAGAFNAGFVAVNLRDLWMYFVRDRRTPIKSPYAVGRAIGQLYYLLLVSSYFSQLFVTVAPDSISPFSGDIDLDSEQVL